MVFSKNLSNDSSNTFFRLIVMAAGYSHRFGAENKLLAPFLGEPLCVPILRAAEFWHKNHKDNSICLLVSSDIEVRRLGELMEFVHIENTQAYKGQSESIKAGIGYNPDWGNNKNEYAVFLPADQPLLTKEDLEQFLLAIMESEEKLFRSIAGDRYGSPTAFHRTYFPDLIQLEGDEGGRSIFSRYPDDTKHIPMRPEALEDVDTAQDLLYLQQLQIR